MKYVGKTTKTVGPPETTRAARQEYHSARARCAHTSKFEYLSIEWGMDDSTPFSYFEINTLFDI